MLTPGKVLVVGTYSIGGTLRSDWAALIRKVAPRYNVDPKAALAVASMEGLSGRVGDGGHAFGPFQLNDAGGVLTNRAGNHRAFAESPAGIAWALQRIGQVAGGETGPRAIQDIVNRFERPAAPAPEIAGAVRAYGGIPAGSYGAGSSNGRTVASEAPGAGSSPAPASILALLASMSQQQQGTNPMDIVNGNVTAGASPGVEQMAQQRNALMAAAALGLSQQSNPAAQHFTANHAASAANHGAGGPASSAKGLSGDTTMQTGGKSPYSNLRFASGVDWVHINPRLLKTVNAAAASHGVVADINSGYRSNQHSLQVGGFAGDPHTKGLAIDAYVKGRPIGDVIPANSWAKYGVTSGAVPNFYHGQSDPEHLQLP